MSRVLVFVVPGSLSQRTGGYLFGRRVVEGLRALGREVRVAELPGCFPEVDARARQAARAVLSEAPDRAVLVIDGLALPAFDASLVDATRRHPVVGFIHHPLALETGLSAGRAARLGAIETALWSRLHGVICASAHTARGVRQSGVPPGRIAVAEPGVDPQREPRFRARDVDTPVRLLCVATITPRKGHRVLVDALSRIRSRHWRLDCIGSLERDPDEAHRLRQAIAASGLGGRVTLHGEQSDEMLERAWSDTDLFVLPSYHEGYGMVFTEALARGIPVVATRGGATPETIPARACQLVEPGDVEGLSRVIESLLDQPERLRSLAVAAREASTALVSWPDAVRRWADTLDRLVGRIAA